MVAGVLQGLAVPASAGAASLGSAVFRGDAMLIGSGMPAPRTNNFTYEFYFKMTALPAVAGTNTVGGGIWLFTTRPNRYSAGGITVFVNTNGSLSLTANDSASKNITEILSASGSVSVNNWYHLAITRSDNVFTIWKNGTSVATGSALSAASGSTGDYNGTDLSLGEYLPGNITNFRYSSGIALYTSTFTPPTSQLTANGTSQILISLESDYSSITSYSSFIPSLTQPTGLLPGKTAYYGGQGYTDATGNINPGVPATNDGYLTNNGITYSSFNPFVKSDPTFNWPTVSKNVGDASFTLAAPTPSTPGTFTYSSATTSVISLSGTTATVGSAGTSVITATFTPTNTADYNSATTTMTITVIGSGQTINFGAISDKIISDTPPVLSATATSGLAVAFTSATTGVCTVSGTSVTFVGPGTCTINADQAGNGTYAAAPQIQRSFAIAYLTQTITFDALAGATLGASSAPLIRGSASSGLAVAYLSITPGVCSVSGSTISMLNPGTCTISASQIGNGTYSAATTINQSFAITAKPDDGQKELLAILALIPSIGELTLSLGETAQSLYKQKCVKGKSIKYVKSGAKCPKGYAVYKKKKVTGS
jgi:hypothetical protein